MACHVPLRTPRPRVRHSRSIPLIASFTPDHPLPPPHTHRLELIVWQVPRLVGDAVAVSFVGFFLGPIFPIAMNHAGRILPPELISGSVSWMASFGSAGGAVFPFITGAIASGTSINSLQPLLVLSYGMLFRRGSRVDE